MRDLICEECDKEFVEKTHRKYCSKDCQAAAKKGGRKRGKRPKKVNLSPKVKAARRMERMEQNMEDLIEQNKQLIQFNEQLINAHHQIMIGLNDLGRYIPEMTAAMVLQNMKIQFADVPITEEE